MSYELTLGFVERRGVLFFTLPMFLIEFPWFNKHLLTSLVILNR